MVLIVETGSGSSTAEAYISVADADTYIDLYSKDVTWGEADDEERERALRIGAQYLDNKYRSQLHGRKANDGQALLWPREDVTDFDGLAVSSTAVPENVRRANAEAALRHLSNSLMPDETSSDTGIRLERVRVGSIEEEIEYVGEKTQQPSYPTIDRLMGEYLTPSQGLERA